MVCRLGTDTVLINVAGVVDRRQLVDVFTVPPKLGDKTV